jgi:hypothetical protein
MAYNNVRGLTRVESKIQAARGTPETTMTNREDLISFDWSFNQERDTTEEMLGSFSPYRDTTLTARTLTANAELRVSYERLPWWLRLALDGSSGALAGVTTGSTPVGYTYTQTPNDTADDLEVATFKVGDGAQVYTLSRMAVNTFNIRANWAGGEADWRATAEMMGIFTGTSTFDSPSAISRNIVSGVTGNKVYIDTSSAIGTTQITGRARSFSVNIANNIEEKRFAESGLDSHTDFGRGFQVITGEIVLEALDDAQFLLMRNDTDIKLRIEQTGANIGATPTTDYRVRIDLPQAKLGSPSRSLMGQNWVWTFPFIAEKPTASQAITVATVNAAATVPA